MIDTKRARRVLGIAAVAVSALASHGCGDPSWVVGDGPDGGVGLAQFALELEGPWRLSVVPLGPERLGFLPYWPFSTEEAPADPDWDEVQPVLVASPIDQHIDPAGCGELAWYDHPVPGVRVPGPYCVALYSNADGVPLIVAGRPGGYPYVFLPARDVTSLTTLTDGTARFDMQRLGAGPLPADGLELCRRWAKTPSVAVELGVRQ